MRGFSAKLLISTKDALIDANLTNAQEYIGEKHKTLNTNNLGRFSRDWVGVKKYCFPFFLSLAAHCLMGKRKRHKLNPPENAGQSHEEVIDVF